VLEADFGRLARMELKGEDPAAGAGVVVEGDARAAVDRRPDRGPDPDDLVGVPVAGLDVSFAPLRPEPGAPVLFVELGPPAGSDVGLVALHLAVREHGAPELDTAVAAVVDELHLERQPEVLSGEVAPKKLVPLQPRRLADDLAVLDRPERGVPLPAGKVA